MAELAQLVERENNVKERRCILLTSVKQSWRILQYLWDEDSVSQVRILYSAPTNQAPSSHVV